MRLNHINLFSSDVIADRAMFERYFGMKTLHMQGDSLAVLRDDADMLFVLNRFGKADGFAYPDNFIKLHIGFLQESRDDVDALNSRLKADGWTVQEPREFHGAWTFYFRAKGGYFIEVATGTHPQDA